MKQPNYRGRFAPSPTGELHMGSLVSALASFIQARANNGSWQVRIEDLDRPRAMPGASRLILNALAAHGLLWDGEPIYQSRRVDAYCAAVQRLLEGGKAFWCGCSRREALTGPMGSEGPIYSGRCRAGLPSGCEPRTVRLLAQNEEISFIDSVQGEFTQNIAQDAGDFVLRRADKIYAYQLAVVVDDGADKITEVVRGADLLASTPRQIFLQRQLDLATPAYLHTPVVTLSDGRKLSKQHGALPLERHAASEQLHRGLTLLRQQPPAELARLTPWQVLDWAIANWRPTAIPQTLSHAESYPIPGTARS